MDTVTQMLLGATVAQAGFRPRLGRRAIAGGAVLGLLPDLDVVAGWVGGPVANALHHRGVTHGVLFGPLAGLLLGWLIWRWQRRRHGPDHPTGDRAALGAWIWLAILAIATHPIIDLFTSYGTQLLAPFSSHRFAINAMPIIDPLYSLLLIIAVIVGLFCRSRPQLARNVAAAALFGISAYTLWALSLSERAEAAARAQLGASARVTAYATMFQPHYRRLVAETDDAVLVAFASASNPDQIAWSRHPRQNDPRIALVAATREGRVFEWFAMGRLFWSVEALADGWRVTATDYRYGLAGATELGFWGISAHVSPDGNVGPVAFIERRPDSGDPSWKMLMGKVLAD